MINVSTRQLRAFVDLAELRNFTRAAGRSHLSQPAFSALIRALEDALGARLFHRTTRSVELTVEGLAFMESARRVLDDAEQAVKDVRDLVSRQRGRVSLAVLPSLAAGWLPPLLARFHAEHPGVELRVADVLSEACIQYVQSGRADFAIASTRVDSDELHTQAFCTDSFHVVCRADHELAARRRLRLGDLADTSIVQLARSSSVRQCVEAAIYPAQLNTVLELDQLSSVAGMVRAGLGLTIVPTLTLFHFDVEGLVTRPLEAPGLTRQIFIVRRSDRTLSIAAQGLYDALLAARPGAQAPGALRARRQAGAPA